MRRILHAISILMLPLLAASCVFFETGDMVSEADFRRWLIEDFAAEGIEIDGTNEKQIRYSNHLRSINHDRTVNRSHITRIYIYGTYENHKMDSAVERLRNRSEKSLQHGAEIYFFKKYSERTSQGKDYYRVEQY